jgi:hypothetical protein
MVVMRTVLKNRNRKERTAVLLYFRKYRELAKMAGLFKLVPSHTTSHSEALREVTTQYSQPTNAVGHYQKESRIFSNSSGYIDEPLRHSHISKSRSKLSALQASQIKAKGKENNVDIQKFKEYIKTQEETEARLAV